MDFSHIFIVITVTAAFAWIILLYQFIARPRGWPVTDSYADFTSVPGLFALSSLPGTAVVAITYDYAWAPLYVLIIALVLAFIFIVALRQRVQVFAFPGLIISWGIALVIIMTIN